MSKREKKSHVKVSLWDDGGEIKGHVDLPSDGTMVFEAMKLVFAEFCRANKYSPETVHADFYRFCVFEDKAK